uniref:Collagenolytic serine protease n=1 Tax=Eriocheir sinensis TaxID=95602 RepID=A0A2D1N4X6_ERISI|nr:collagenolytic serine protease [Eriocheir sinensis]
MIRKIALLLACLALANGNPAAGKEWIWKSRMPVLTPEGTISRPATRIVGGSEAVPHSWPHQVGLFIDNMYFCGGSLISNEWVLTAAHCTDGAGFVEVVMGAHYIRQNEDTQVSMTSTDFMVHEQWDPNTLNNDISVIRLPSPVTFNENIQAVALPSTDVNVGDIVTPSGWGKPSDDALGTSSVLRQVDNPVITVLQCASVYGSIIDQRIVCTDTTGGKGTCNGDSGGPLKKDGKNYGVTSFVASAGCESGYPDGFTRVVEFLDWIEAKTGVTP